MNFILETNTIESYLVVALQQKRFKMDPTFSKFHKIRTESSLPNSQFYESSDEFK